MGDGEKLLTYLNSALKALLGFDIFPRGTKIKSEILLPSVIIYCPQSRMQQNRQYTYKVTLRRDLVTILAVEKQ